MERVNREIPTFGIRDWRTKLKAALACKMFDTIISPILTYNSEIWGVYPEPDFKTWDGSQIEKAQTTKLLI